MSTEILKLSGGYHEVFKNAVIYSNRIHMEEREILNRNALISTDLERITNDSCLTIDSEKLPKYIYMLIEDFASLKTENDRLRLIHEQEGRKI